MRKYFAWEYKRKRRNLTEAYQQLLLYRKDLENEEILARLLAINLQRKAAE